MVPTLLLVPTLLGADSAWCQHFLVLTLLGVTHVYAHAYAHVHRHVYSHVYTHVYAHNPHTGKRIAVPFGSISHYQLLFFLRLSSLIHDVPNPLDPPPPTPIHAPPPPACQSMCQPTHQPTSPHNHLFRCRYARPPLCTPSIRSLVHLLVRTYVRTHVWRPSTLPYAHTPARS